LHTPAQPSKRQRLPSVSPYKNRQVAVPESDSDGVDSDSLFDSTSTHKHGFKRQLQPWSLVKKWSGCLRRNQDNFDAVFGRSRFKNIYQAQFELHCKMANEADELFLPLILCLLLTIFLCCRTMCPSLGAKSRLAIHLFVHLLIDAAAVSYFEFLRLPSQSSWKHRSSILPSRDVIETSCPRKTDQ
jgi:hypothetical protein